MATASKRNYRKEYDNYQGSSKQKKNRASRNAAAKKKPCPKGKEVGHKDGNPRNNAKSNLKCQTVKSNRSYKRTKTAGKKNKKD